ncbi:MAG: hypothetical protein DRR04_05335 [Gammaproteobacteria bacterium]|nr:MAG: hypothetical protein DRQ97_06735 [Gammaproteobacteria bacterium]RLA60551.1 MAG: hypothetical protein DRR04_05335 [Gammaproteobacteria bacterium]
MDLAVYGAGALNILLIGFLLIIITALIAFAVFLWQRHKRFGQFTAIIWFRDGFGQLQQTHDTGGVFVDKKTANKRLFLRRNNVGLSPDNIPFLTGPKGKRYVYLYQRGLKNFLYLRPNVRAEGVSIEVGEEDVNWAINAYERQKKLFASNMLLQYMPFIALAFVSIIILIIFIYFFKDFKVLAEVAEALKGAAQAFAQAQAGTAIIPS